MSLVTEEQKDSVSRHINFSDTIYESNDITMGCTQTTEQDRPKTKLVYIIYPL